MGCLAWYVNRSDIPGIVGVRTLTYESKCSGASTSLLQLILARVLTGISGGGMVSLISIIITGKTVYCSASLPYFADINDNHRLGPRR